MNRLRITNRADFLSGLLFIAIGLFGLVEALQYEMGDARRMGAGYFPVILGAVLAALGVITAATSVGVRAADDAAGTSGEAAEDAAAKEESVGLWPALRASFFVVGSLVVFALALPRIGLVLSVFALVFISSFADRSLSWNATGVIAVFMAFVSVAIFRWGIGLPLAIWP